MTNMSTTIMTKLEDFHFKATSNIEGDLSDLQGKYVILYFYPKDNTPGCTKESKDFRDLHRAFEKFNAVIYGVSKDSLKSHEAFKEKLELPFDLISDSDGSLCKLFKTNKTSTLIEMIAGIERSTFLIDPQGNLLYEWRKVKTSGHVEEVLKVLTAQSES
jgi:thioredoxin-dependent peroxiredoxin